VALGVALGLDDVEVIVCGTHLGLQARERRLQVDALLAGNWLGSYADRPVVLCGDFNFLPRSEAYARETARLRDVQVPSLAGQAARPTWPSSQPLFRIDHVFLGGSVVPVAASVPHSTLIRNASDHLPVVVDLELPGD